MIHRASQLLLTSLTLITMALSSPTHAQQPDRVGSLTGLEADMCRWHGDLHRMPETAMEEHRTAEYVATLLRDMGYEVTTGVGGTGVVATLKNGTGTRSIGLRAELDALPIEETNDLDYRSEREGYAHLCGHDAHMTMLLGAAKYLAETRDFSGTVTLILQPGEETMQGSSAMLKDGLFDRFPVDMIAAMHNMPGLPKGQLLFHDGPSMTSVDNWTITLTGSGGHGSMPELTRDPVVAAASLVMSLQTIVSRNVSPWDQSVVTIGSLQAGSAGNVIPETATLMLSVRNMSDEARTMVLDKIRRFTSTTAEAYGCTYEITEGPAGPVLINDPKVTAYMAGVAKRTFGEDQVAYPGKPYMSSDDFAYMLQQRPGTFIFIGNGDTPMVHNPTYYTDQEILKRGANLWIAIVEDYLQDE